MRTQRAVVHALRPRAPAARIHSENPDNIHFGEVLDVWLASSALKHKRSTHSTYETVAERHIRPRFGALRVSDITPETTAEFLRDKLAGSAKEPPLSSSTVCSIVTVLRAVLRCAGTMGCTVNAWGALSRPRLDTAEAGVLSAPEQERLEAFLRRDESSERLGVLVCLYTGLRLGEICALKWGDISLDAGTLAVRRTVQRIRNAEYEKSSRGNKTIVVFDAPKSRHSNRTIPLPSFLQEVLRERQCSQNCFLLTGDPVSFIEPRTFQNKFKSMLKDAGVRDINFHALRHTFATNCVDLGFDPKTLSEILGHADVSVTLNTYVHPSLSRMRGCMELLEGRGGGERNDHEIK